MPLELPDELAATQRTIDDDGDSPLPRERQEPILGLAFEEVVGELDEVERVGAHEALHLVVAAPVRSRDPHVAQPAGGLHGEESPQVLLGGHEVVDLQQVEAGNAPATP